MIREAEIGPKVRDLRVQAGLTLEKLAKKAGLSQGYLSKIENSRNAPPVSTLLMIARALGISMSVLFGEDGRRNRISFIKKEEREDIARDGSIFGYSYQPLAHKYYHKNFEPYIMTVPANPKRDPNFHFAHTGEEMLMVLKGKMEFYYGDQRFLLDEGDCLYFDASVPHNGFCREGDQVECLLVIYTPK